MTLVDAGAEPRRALRYHVAKGSTRTIQLAIDIDMDTGAVRGSMPTMMMLGDISVDDLVGDGGMHMKMTIHDIQLHDRPGSPISADLVRKQLGALDGFTISGVLSPLGAMTDVAVDAKNVPPQLQGQIASMSQNLKQLAIPLPDAPLGLGAKWDLSKTVEQAGMKMTTTTHVTLTKLDGDVVGFHTEVDISAPPQTIQQPGMTIELTSVTGGGKGDGTIDLGSFAVGGQSSTGFQAHLKAGGQEATSGMRMQMTMTPLAKP